MTTFNIVRGRVDNRVRNSDSMPAIHAEYLDSETIDDPTSSETIVNAAVGGPSQYWVITASGGDGWIEISDSPTAVVNSGWLILNGQTRDFSAKEGQKVAVINA